MRNIDTLSDDDPGSDGGVVLLQIGDEIGTGVASALAIAQHDNLTRGFQIDRDAFVIAVFFCRVAAVVIVVTLAVFEPPCRAIGILGLEHARRGSGIALTARTEQSCLLMIDKDDALPRGVIICGLGRSLV